MSALDFLLAPFLMCLLLVGIHCYLGLHVLRRGIIFIDLSLAQVASLGSTVALLLHLEHHTTQSYFISLGFTIFAAGYFAFVKKYERYIAQEVLIAIVYAFSSAAVILVLNSIAHGSEHIKEVLIGKILWVTWPDLIKTLIIYTIVAIIHFIYRDKFIALSNKESLVNPLKWDFIFYALFGVVITSSVGLAGILLVFSFLIVPAQLALLFQKSIKGQLIFGWILGSLLSLIGMSLSYFLDLPAGAVLVVCFTILPVIIIPLGLFPKTS